MTNVILLGAPLLVVIGFLSWVLSFYGAQEELNRELWKKHGVEV